MNKLTKFSRAIVAIATMLVVALPSIAHDFNVNGIYYNYLDKTAKTVEVTYKGSSYYSYSNEYTGSITIPSSVTYSGTAYSVTSIGSNAFNGCTGLTSVTIPNSVTEIGSWAFNDCDGLTSITIPNSVTSIGDYAFYDCSNLKLVINLSNLTFSKGSSNYGCVAYYANKVINAPNNSIVGDFAFSKTDNINTLVAYIGNATELILPTDFNGENYKIGDYAFAYRSNIFQVTIPNSVTSIGDKAFYECTGLTSVTIPNSLTSIGDDAFSYCSGLTSVTIGNSVTSIGKEAFYRTGWYNNQPNGILYLDNCCLGYKGDKPTGSLSLKEGTRLIGENAFRSCSGLTSVTIPNSVISIGENAFDWCTGLTSVTIPNSVTSIGRYAFDWCTGLTSITIPNSVTSIGEYAFDYCNNLKTIISLNPTPPTCGSSDSFYNYSKTTLYVPKDSYAKYFVDEVWGQFSNIKKIETLVSSITLNETTLNINSGSDYTLKTTISPSNATIPNLSWHSDNLAVATVNQNGKVTGVSAGTATITVRANDGSNVSDSCKVIVNSVTPTITLSQTQATLPVNEIMTLSYSITNSTTKTATWSTSDANVAYVKTNSDGSATIVGMADGVATITATLIDNGKEYSASCVVTVGVGGIESVEADNNAVEVARYDIHGRLLSEPAPGINIVKYSDGTTRKEIVK